MTGALYLLDKMSGKSSSYSAVTDGCLHCDPLGSPLRYWKGMLVEGTS